jgi:carbon monoxide dehydrogenase subunit G
MLQFEGTEDLPRSPSDVWPQLNDAGRLAEFIPDRESLKSAAADEAVCVVHPGFSFVRGTLEMTIRVLERKPESEARVNFHSKGVGATSDVEVSFRLEPLGEGTRVHWKAEVKQMTGLLRFAPQGLVRGAAQKVVRDIWTNVRAKLQA